MNNTKSNTMNLMRLQNSLRKTISLMTILSFFVFTAAAQDFTVQVPSPPTSCYSDKDNYLKSLDAAIDEVKAQNEKKENAMKAKAQGMTQEEKMKIAMQYQKMSPDEIVKMQKEQEELQQLMQEVGTKESDRINKFNELSDEYNNARKAKLDPLMAEAMKLPDGEGAPAWAGEKAAQLMAQYNKEYEILCNQYITGPAATFPKWLADYKTYLLQTKVPYLKRVTDIQFRQMGGLTPDESVYVLNVEKEYLDYARTIYTMRHAVPQGE